MLSLLPAMLCVPMEELTPTLPIRKEIREALEGRDNRDGRLLSWLKGHESGHRKACEGIIQSSGIRPERLGKFYIEAVIWADNQLVASD